MILFMKRSVFMKGLIVILILFVLPVFSEQTVLLKQEAEEEISLPIIMYHEVKPYRLGKDVIAPEEFLQDLCYLRDRQFSTVTMSQVIDYVYKGIPLPKNPIMLTFDDGYLNNYHYVFPLLKEYNMKIVLSVIGKNTDDFTRIPDRSLDYSHVTWEQLKEMTDSGLVEVQNHTYNLHHYDKKGAAFLKKKDESREQYEKRITQDLVPYQKQIYDATGFEPAVVTYPYGVVSKETDDILKKLGFSATLSCKYGVNKISHDPEELFRLKRICRSHQNSLERVLKAALKSRL